jgi:hypothetical protein
MRNNEYTLYKKISSKCCERRRTTTGLPGA